MSRNHLERFAPLSGIAYAVLSVVGIALVSDSPEASDSNQAFLSYYGDSAHRAREIAAFFLFVVAALFFIWFVAALRSRLRMVESEPRGLSALAFGTGVASAALLTVAVAVGTVVSFTLEDTGQFVVDPNLARLLADESYLVLIASTMVASILVAATSILAIRTNVLPRWLGWVGAVASLTLLAAFLFFPIMVLWAWVVLVSVVLTVRSPVAAAPYEPEPRVA